MNNFRALLIILTIAFFSASCATLQYKKEIKEHRIAYKEDFQNSDHAPLKGSQLNDMAFYPADDKYVVKAKVIINESPENYDIETSSGMKKSFYTYGHAEFTLDDMIIKLELIRNLKVIQMPQYKDYLFLAFKDLTNGEDTYGGGRYIDLYISEIEEGHITIDFNKAYNPYCAYSDGYNCPIPPASNYINLEIKAGEKMYKGPYLGKH